MMWDALKRAKSRQYLLASKMQKIMMFLYEAYKNPKQKSIQTGTTPMIEDISSRSATSINDVPKDSADALERAEVCRLCLSLELIKYSKSFHSEYNGSPQIVGQSPSQCGFFRIEEE